VTRKTADLREKELRLAVYRIERGRAVTKASKLSISSVAREAGVTPSLIHNHYPVIAELIRAKKGRSVAARIKTKDASLREQRAKTAELQRELKHLRSEVARLATINEMLLVDNRALTAGQQGDNIVPFSRNL
jgi:septal ring factor EnvC (AmiA/AmiB activator)